MAGQALEFRSIHRPAAADLAAASLRAVDEFEEPRSRWCHGLAGSKGPLLWLQVWRGR